MPLSTSAPAAATVDARHRRLPTDLPTSVPGPDQDKDINMSNQTDLTQFCAALETADSDAMRNLPTGQGLFYYAADKEFDVLFGSNIRQLIIALISITHIRFFHSNQSSV